MSDISYIRKGIIQNVEDNSIHIKMNDSSEILSWPLQDGIEVPKNNSEITLELHVKENTFETKDEDQMRKLLEDLVN